MQRHTRGVRLLRRAAVAIGLVAALSACSMDGAQPRQDGTTPPNVLVIVADDQRLGAMGAMRATREVFRREGVNYTNAFVTTPYCCPSRASIMSGLYTHNHDVRTGIKGEAETFDEERSMQGELKDAGYRNAVFGKFLNGWNLGRSPEHFDQWAIFSESAPDGYYGGTWNVDGTKEVVEPYSTTFIKRRALRFMNAGETSDDQPWFMYLAPAAPHAPYVAEPRFEDADVGKLVRNPATDEADRSDKPDFVQSRERGLYEAKSLRRRQLRTLMSVDRMVGALFRALRELREENTLVVFTSDNGYLWGEHRLAHKRFPYLPSVHVPFLVRWPDEAGAGTREDRMVANIDIAPTVFDLAGIDPTYELDGRSLLGDHNRERILLEFWGNPNSKEADGGLPSWSSTVTDAYQYIEWYTLDGELIEAEYYDLRADPWELQNLLGDDDPANDPVVQPLSAQLAADKSCRGQTCP